MNLSTATQVAQSALATVSAESTVVSRNIAGVNSSGTFTQKIANVVTTQDGGVGSHLGHQCAKPGALRQRAQRDLGVRRRRRRFPPALTTLQTTVGEPGSDTSPAEKLSDFTDALQQYEASPSNVSLAQAAVTAAQDLASTLNSATTTVQQVREQADSADGVLGLDDQFAADAVSERQSADRRRHRGRRRRHRLAGYAQFDPHPALAANRHHDDAPAPTATCRSIPTAA